MWETDSTAVSIDKMCYSISGWADFQTSIQHWILFSETLFSFVIDESLKEISVFINNPL